MSEQSKNKDVSKALPYNPDVGEAITRDDLTLAYRRGWHDGQAAMRQKRSATARAAAAKRVYDPAKMSERGKRGGWPKGKRRGPRAPKETMPADTQIV